MPGTRIVMFREPLSDKLSWLRLRELTGIPSKGRELFSGTLAERNRLFREFRAFVSQAEAYWSAAAKTEGPGAALLHYYALLNLAKAELLQSHPSQVLGQNVRHGASAKMTATDSIRSDAIITNGGVLTMLWEKRTGSPPPANSRLPIMNLIAQIPEISHEVNRFGRVRPSSHFGYHTFAGNDSEAWSLVGLPVNLTVEEKEPAIRKLLRSYDVVERNGYDWRLMFALSTRMTGHGLEIFQSKEVFSVTQEGVARPDYNAAMKVLHSAVGDHLASPLGGRAEFAMSHSLRKSSPFAVPLPLARYALTYYISSIVRYRPAKLDPIRQGDQAWLMNSVVSELPINLLADAVDGICGSYSYFEPAQYRV